MSEQDSESIESAGEADTAASVGLLLRKAREARGLSVADVVSALKYSPRQIEALEADEMPLAPGNVFVRGIVRSYARFLKLDPEPLLALIGAEVPAAPPDVVPPDDMGVAMPRSGGRQISALVAAAILITIVAVALGVWHFLAPPIAQPAASAPPAAATDTGGSVAAAGSPSPSSSMETVPVPVPVVPPELASTTAQANQVENPALSAVQPIPAQSKQLIFSFRGTSWVEVKDVSRRVIFTGQYVGGTRQVAQGEPPFQIVIGNAPLVDLTYEGQSVDLKPYIRADVARLTLE